MIHLMKYFRRQRYNFFLDMKKLRIFAAELVPCYPVG